MKRKRRKNQKAIRVGGLPVAKNGCFNFAQTILHNNIINQPLRPNGLHFRFLKWLFAYHPRAAEKIPTPIVAICVIEKCNDVYATKTRCFYYKCECGYKDTISYRTCVDAAFATPKGRKYRQYRAVWQAARNTIELYKLRTARQLLPAFVQCAITGATIAKKDAEIDHYEKNFSEMVVAFIAQQGIDFLLAAIQPTPTPIFLPLVAIDFIKFHDANTKLRIVSREQNALLNAKNQKKGGFLP